MKKKISKIFALVLAFVILLGTFTVNAMAEETEPKEYKIKIVYSKNVSESEKDVRAVEYYGSDTKLKKAKAGDRVVVRNGAGLKCIVEGKLVSDGQFIMPDHDVVIYVDNNYRINRDQIRAEELKEKPDSYVTVTLKSGDHGNFGYKDYQDKNSVIKEKKYYVPKYRKVSIYEWISDISKGYVVKKENDRTVWDKPSQDITLTEDTDFTAQYEEKNLTFTFRNVFGHERSTTLPAQALTSELKETAQAARSKNLPQNVRFIGWTSQDSFSNWTTKDSVGKYYSYSYLLNNEDNIFAKDNGYIFDHRLDEGAKYNEILTTDHIVSFYDRDFINCHYFTFAIDGSTIPQLDENYSYYKITKLGSYDKETGRTTPHEYDNTQKFNFSTPIKEDTNLVAISNFSDTKRLWVVSDPKMVYDSIKNETTIDLSGMIVEIINPDGSRKLVPYSEFETNEIKTDVKNGQAINGLDKKHIKITKGDYFTFSNEPFDIKDDNFDKENINEITIAQDPQLEYKYDGDKNRELNLDGLKVNIKDKNDVTRKDIPYSEFNDYGLTVKLDDVKVSNGRKMNEADNGNKLKVFFNETVSAETKELKVTTSKFDESNIDKVEITNKPKLNYIVGDKLDLSKLEVKLTDTNGNEKNYKFGNEDFTRLFDITLNGGSDLSKSLTKEEDSKYLKISLKGKDISAKIDIRVVDFDESHVTRIEVVRSPKLIYKSGDKLDLSELVVKLVDKKGTIKEVKFAEFEENYLKTSIPNETLITDQTGPITITYKNGDTSLEVKTGNLYVEVLEPTLENDKVAAKIEIESLQNLTVEEKEAVEKSINEANSKEEVKKILEEAKKKDAEAKAAKDAAELKDAKKAAKEEVNKLENIDEEAKNAANKNIDDANSKEEVNKILDDAKKKDAKAKAGKELEQAKEAEKAAKEKEKAAEEAKTAVDKVKAEADVKVKETEKAREEAEAKATEAEKAAKEAKAAAEAETDPDKKVEAKQKAEEAEEAAKIAKEKVETAKKDAEEAKATAEEAKEAAAKAENELEKARLEVKKAEEKVKEKQKAVDEFKKKPETPDDPQPQPQPQPEPEQKPEPNESGHNYNPFWFGYFVSNAKTDNKTDAKSGIAAPVKLDSKLAIGSKTLKVTVNGVERKVEMDVAPFIDSNRTMLPIRFVAEALGFKVEWDEPSRTVILTDKDNVVKIPVDTNKIIVNGNEYESDVKPVLRNNRTMLPIGNVARALGLVDGKDIIWDSATRTVVIKREIEK